MVARLVRDQEARGSNPRTPTIRQRARLLAGSLPYRPCGDLNCHRSRRGRLHRPVLTLGDSFIPALLRRDARKSPHSDHEKTSSLFAGRFFHDRGCRFGQSLVPEPRAPFIPFLFCAVGFFLFSAQSDFYTTSLPKRQSPLFLSAVAFFDVFMYNTFQPFKDWRRL